MPSFLSVLLVWLGEESCGRLVTVTGEKGHTMSTQVARRRVVICQVQAIFEK